MFNARRKILDDRVHQYRMVRDGAPITYANVLDLWQADEEYLSCFLSLLRDAPFPAYRWETPPISRDTAARDFEFVLVDAPELARTPDRQTFAQHFTDEIHEEDVVVFENLGRDAVLVTPAPSSQHAAYSHLAAFSRTAPVPKQHALWRLVGQQVQQRLNNHPLWLSTAGGGVAWLHVRLDSLPKYYAYAPYRSVGN